MINIYIIFKRFHLQILFGVLVLIGLILTIQQNNYQRTKFINSANSISGGTYSAINNIESYFNLKSINKNLQEENAELRANLTTSLKRINGDYFTIDDTLYNQKYIYRVAEAVSNSYTNPNNYITLNLGENDGVIEEMGVISPKGVVGIVGAVSDNFCTVISFLHPKTEISCKLKSSGVSGFLKWSGKDIFKAVINDIPITTRIREGDSILTSGHSSVFPAGIFIGTIESSDSDLDNQMQHIVVHLNIDYSSLNKVYIVENLFKSEIEELHKKEKELDE